MQREDEGNEQEGKPLDVLNQRVLQPALAKSVLEHRVPKVARTGEHNSDGQPDLKRVEVEGVNLDLPTAEQVVEHSEDEADRNAV